MITMQPPCVEANSQPCSAGQPYASVSQLSLRRQHAVFHSRKYRWGDPTESGGPKDLAWLGANGHELVDANWSDFELRTLGMFLNKSTLNGDSESEASFLVVLHAGSEPVDFKLPDRGWASAWTPVLDTTVANGVPALASYAAGANVPMAARSLLVLRETD